MSVAAMLHYKWYQWSEWVSDNMLIAVVFYSANYKVYKIKEDITFYLVVIAYYAKRQEMQLI